MLSQMNHIVIASRTIFRLTKGRGEKIRNKRQYVATANIYGTAESLIHTSSTVIPSSDPVSERATNTERSDPRRLDDKLSISLMRKTVSHGLGLKISRNRDILVHDFFNLSKEVMENKISVEEFENSETFKKLQEEVEYNIDLMGNSQTINILASLIKMRMNPSTHLVKLLEHEIEFRMKSFNLNQVIKILKFYNTIQISSDRRHLIDMLSYRIRFYIQSATTTVKDLNSVLHMIAAQQAPSSLLALIEEKLLNLLAIPSEEDIVSKYIAKPDFDYESLCDLFMKLAANNRRPTPILKSASIWLCKKTSTKRGEEKPRAETIISTLAALVNLNYHNRALLSKLLLDLTNVMEVEKIDAHTICNLLRCLCSLRWRPNDLLLKISSYIQDNNQRLDHHMTVALINAAAFMNFGNHDYIKQFYHQCMAHKEQDLDKRSRKWLNYVWSLVILNLASGSHITSVLSPEFYASIERVSGHSGYPSAGYFDMMKLLNLQALAKYEYKLTELDCKHFDRWLTHKVPPSINEQKFDSKIQNALNGVVKSQSDVRYGIQTPFGFTIDCELLLDNNLNPVALDSVEPFEEIIKSTTGARQSFPRRVALIYAFYDDIIANTDYEVVGRKKVFARILKSIGYHTVFLPETLINNESTSAGLTTRIQSLINASLSNESQLS